MIDLKSRSSLMRFTVSFVLTFLAIGLGLYGTSKYWQNFDSEPKILSFREDLVEDLFFEEDGAIREVVTPNLHVCFGFYYHYPELRPHLHLLRPKSTQADGWEKSHTEIQVLAPDRLKEFQQFIVACYVTSLNNFPDLDPIVWAESNSFSYTYREMNPLQGVYRFTKDEWVNASTTQNGNVSYRAKKRPGLSFRKIRVIRLAITYSRTASWRHYHWRLRA